MFGVVKNKIMYGKKVKGIERSTFLIDAARRAARRMARHQGGRPRGRSAQGRQGAEEGRLNHRRRPAAASAGARPPPQSRTAPVRLFSSEPDATTPCHCPSRLPESATCSPPPTSSAGRAPRRQARARSRGRRAEPQAALDLHDVAPAAAAAWPPPACWRRRPPAPRRAAPRGRRAAARRARRRRARARPRKPRGTGPAKLFVLDTNVLMHDPMSLFRFEEHDIFLPMITLEELDNHKKGMSEVARNARQVSRDLDALATFTGQGRRLDATRRHRAGQDRPPRSRRQAVLPDHAAGRQAARRPAAGQGRQPDPGRGAEPARAAARARRGAGVQGHQHARQGARAGPAGRGLLQRQDAGRRRPALHRRAAAAGRLLGAPWQDHGELAAGRPHLLPHQRAAGAGAADQPVRLPRDARRRAAVRARDRDHRQDRGAEDAARLHATPRTPCGA